MNILQIYDGYSSVEPGSGAMAVVYQLSKYLVRAGHQVTILERMGREKEKDIEYMEGIKFVRIKAKKRASSTFDVIYKFPFGLVNVVADGFEFAASVNRYLNKVEKPFDILHVHFPMAANALILLNKNLRRKMVYTFHGDAYRLNLNSQFELPWHVKFLSPDLFLMRRVKKMVLLNNSVYSKLVSSNKIPAEKAVSIHNGIDVTLFNPETGYAEIRQKYGLNSKIIVLFVGIIFPRKGVDYLVKAAGHLVTKLGYRDMNFLLVGSMDVDREYVAGLQRFIAACGLEKEVKMVGRVPFDELKKLYATADIFVLPSLEEACASVVTEAMAMGKPVIGTKVGGALMQIRDGWNGFLAEPRNEADLAEKIKYLIDHPEERNRMGANSRKRAVEEFSWERVAEKYVKVYQEVME